VNPEAPNAKLDYKNLQVMVHYELGNYETVRTMLESYKSFIRRSGTVSKDNKVYYRNFVYYTEKLINFINNRNKTYIGSLTEKINTTDKLVYKDWLLKKVEILASEKTKAA
jgi:deoxyadenosine/deoxycytidine kinase